MSLLTVDSAKVVPTVNMAQEAMCQEARVTCGAPRAAIDWKEREAGHVSD